MPYLVKFDEELSCFIASLSGVLTVQDVHGFVNEALNDSRWKIGMNGIIDYSAAVLQNLTSPDVMLIAKIGQELNDKIGSGRIAVVVSKAVDYGMVRMWENMVHGQVSFTPQIFTSMEEARKWVAR